jgi:ribonuclease VapC
MVVVDASAVLALMLGETGSDVVLNIINDAEMTAVNLSECMQRAIDRDGSAAVVAGLVNEIGVQIVPFDAELARITAELRLLTKSKGLSLGDRACLALAKMRDVAVYTADKRWDELDIGIDIRLIR